MNGAKDVVVDDDMVVAQVLGRLGKRLDRPCVAAELGLRVNHTSFHRPFPLVAALAIATGTKRKEIGERLREPPQGDGSL
jgi:hypothetical protein